MIKCDGYHVVRKAERLRDDARDVLARSFTCLDRMDAVAALQHAEDMLDRAERAYARRAKENRYSCGIVAESA